MLALGLVPWALLYVGQAGRLYRGLPAEEFRLLCVELQNPQHMLPHLWRTPQWLAFGCYPALALLALVRGRAPWPAARIRFAAVLAVNVAGLVLAWFAIEVLGSLSVTVFQPFRMAALFRGLALVAVAGRVVALWTEGRFLDRARAVMVATALAGDWSLVVATAVDLAVTAAGARWAKPAFGLTLAGGLLFLARHDTDSGHLRLLAALATFAILSRLLRGRAIAWNRRRMASALGLAWVVPLAAVFASTLADPKPHWAAALVDRCRFTAVPIDDVERLGLWCRTHTPNDARFIGPPGPKTFRLWSLRSVAFNRAASPYHAAGLADWGRRFQAHVGLECSTAELVRAYQRDRHGLERRYQSMSDAERAALAVRQGASYVIAAPPADRSTAARDGPLELLHVEGRYAVYRVRSVPQVRAAAVASAGTG
jgi:hypothetical protein